MPSKEKFPPIPEFYGAQPGGQVAPPVTDRSPWARAHETAIPPTKQPMEYLFEVLNDPRNAWIGLGPMGMAVKGSRLIKPLVEAAPTQRFLPAKSKALVHTGSEQAAKILDFNPELGHTVHPIWGGRHQTADSFAGPQEAFQMPGQNGPLLAGQKPPTVDEIVAAQDLLKKMAQQNAPKELTLYRGGVPLKHSSDIPFNHPELKNTPVPVTSDLKIATNFAVPQYGNPQPYSPLFELKVPREDLLANIEKLQRGRGYNESEYLIPLRSFQGAQTRLPFPNPNPYPGEPDATIFKGAEFSKVISDDLPWNKSNAQQSMNNLLNKPTTPKLNAPMGFEQLPPYTQGVKVYQSTSEYAPGSIIEYIDGTYIVDTETKQLKAKSWNEAVGLLHALTAELKQKPLAKP